MTVITASQLKDVIKQALTNASITGIQVFDYSNPDRRKKFPSIEIMPSQPTGEESDERVTRVTQRFDIQFRVRQRGAGSDEVALQKNVEGAVLNAIDATALGQSTLFVLNRIWTRPNALVLKPVSHYLSTLVVLVTDIVSTTGEGQLIAKYTVDFPSLAGMELLNKPLERELENYESIYNDKRLRVFLAPLSDLRTAFFEVEYTDGRMTQLRTLRKARQEISVTLHRPSGNETVTCKITAADHGAPFSEIETITIQIEVL